VDPRDKPGVTLKGSGFASKDDTMAIHPGNILTEEIEARGLSANRLALDLGVPSGRITDILNGKRSISADTALRLARYFGNEARFWLNLQLLYDLDVAESERGREIRARIRPSQAA
jgi:antitoxin HigA-1